jgi:transcription initiation factor TFIIH subunit 1
MRYYDDLSVGFDTSYLNLRPICFVSLHHQAYEEKVPLELSDEQFWRKYLESEYFHRDRGRVGETARNHAGMAANDQQQRSNNKKKSGPSVEEQEARAAAVGTDDLFSRYDQKIRDQQAVADSNAGGAKSHTWGRRLACGQFDLASTYETERGRLLEGPKDNFPPNQLDDGKGSRVIQKYNRHWAMVLHPDDAVAGSDLQSIARKSVDDVLPGDEDPNAGGGIDKEMRQLVDFASAREEDADHAAGIGTHKEHEKLTLSNVEAYHTGLRAAEKASASQEPNDEVIKRHLVAAKAMVSKTDVMARSIVNQSTLPSSCFPPAALGKELLSALTKKMAQDSKTEAASLEVVNKLPKEFRNNLQAYFRRSSELLRHFYGLRKLGAHVPANSQKLARIVGGMETFYREMETMRKALPHSETGETMRKMCLPIMGQLDWAFKLHREGSGGGGGGGFVTVEEG